MGTAVLELDSVRSAPISEAEEASVPRKLWTRAEYRRLIADGFLQDGKVELVNGEIWEKMGQGRRHIAFLTRAFKILGLIFGFDRIQSQSSLPVSANSDPEPDLALLAKDMAEYQNEEPTPEEMLLVVEVSDSTLRADLTAKAQQYGSASIPEYWVIDIPNRLLHVFREPIETGYAAKTILTAEDDVHPLSAPEAVIRVADLLP